MTRRSAWTCTARPVSPVADHSGYGDRPWRVGRKVGRTVYDAHDTLIGVMDSPVLAQLVVNGVNALDALRARPERKVSLVANPCGSECNGTWPGPEPRRMYHRPGCPNDPVSPVADPRIAQGEDELTARARARTTTIMRKALDDVGPYWPDCLCGGTSSFAGVRRGENTVTWVCGKCAAEKGWKMDLQTGEVDFGP